MRPAMLIAGLATGALVCQIYILCCIYRATQFTDRSEWSDAFGAFGLTIPANSRLYENDSGARRLQSTTVMDMRLWSIVSRPEESDRGHMIMYVYPSIVALASKWAWPATQSLQSRRPDVGSDDFRRFYDYIDFYATKVGELRVREIGWPWTVCVQYEVWGGLGMYGDTDLPSRNGIVIKFANILAMHAMTLFASGGLVIVGAAWRRRCII